jgi:hypothetical protein
MAIKLGRLSPSSNENYERVIRLLKEQQLTVINNNDETKGESFPDKLIIYQIVQHAARRTIITQHDNDFLVLLS